MTKEEIDEFINEKSMFKNLEYSFYQKHKSIKEKDEDYR